MFQFLLTAIPVVSGKQQQQQHMKHNVDVLHDAILQKRLKHTHKFKPLPAFHCTAEGITLSAA